MPKTHEMKSSKFLKKEDAGVGVLCTISKVEQHNVAREGAAEDLKWCVLFEEFDKPLVLNITNTNAIELITGSDDTDNWKGKKVVLFNDLNVIYEGKTGGIRIRAPKSQKEIDLPF
jgi:hypothetical protein